MTRPNLHVVPSEPTILAPRAHAKLNRKGELVTQCPHCWGHGDFKYTGKRPKLRYDPGLCKTCGHGPAAHAYSRHGCHECGTCKQYVMPSGYYWHRREECCERGSTDGFRIVLDDDLNGPDMGRFATAVAIPQPLSQFYGARRGVSVWSRFYLWLETRPELRARHPNFIVLHDRDWEVLYKDLERFCNRYGYHPGWSELADGPLHCRTCDPGYVYLYSGPENYQTIVWREMRAGKTRDEAGKVAHAWDKANK